MRASVLAVSLFSAASFAATFNADPRSASAIVILSGDSKVKGTVTLMQEDARSDTLITYNITGLDPNASRGFHVHVSGDLSKGCAGAASHYNPFNAEHGAPKDDNRHVGDLGNIQSDAQGAAIGKMEDPMVKLIGPTSVFGRAIVVHGGTDDLGKGANADSKKTGNAGARPACGVIVHAA